MSDEQAYEHEWEDWGGDIHKPVGTFAQVEVRFRDGTTLKTYAGAGRWDHNGTEKDVMAWRRTTFVDDDE